MFLIFDTETTGLPRDFKAPITDTDNWPRCVQIAWQLHDELGNCIEHADYLIKPEGFDIPYQSEKVHGISTELAQAKGRPLDEVLAHFLEVMDKAKFVVGQNLKFDTNVMGCELYRRGLENDLQEKPLLDTCTEDTAQMCQIPGGRGGKFKLPTLTELHEFLFKEPFAEAHNATADVEATARCFLELVRKGGYSAAELGVDSDFVRAFTHQNPDRIQKVGLKHLNLKAESDKLRQADGGMSDTDLKKNLQTLKSVPFSHLHNHSQFSILQSTTQVSALVNRAADNRMPAVALTDTGNMMAAFHFVKAALKKNKEIQAKIDLAEEEGRSTDLKTIKPIVGCELNVCKNHLDKSFKDNGFQIPFLAKNKNGYHNLAKMSSTGFIEGSYYVPRIDKDVILAHKEDLIVLSGGHLGEIPSLILNVGEEQAEQAFVWWKTHFGEDFYVELIRHGLEEDNRVNNTLLKFCKKYDVKYIASNNTFYIDKEDANAHDILLCVKEGEKKSTPVGRGRGFRFGFPNHEFYFKSPDAMKDLFKDLPEAIEQTNEIIDKIEIYDLAQDVLLPAFDIPAEFEHKEDLTDGGKRGENAFLNHLTYEGAKGRYEVITDTIKERLDFELATIERTGYPGYFLIVQDFIAEARRMQVAVGPGRGSAAGSAVAYCLGITNIDPIKYDLLFERFLNPDRVSLPDIDIDFDDEGRSRVIDYVINKYGSSQVAQIITYGTMAAKSSIRDTGRVLDLPLPDTDRIAKLIPDMKLKKLFGMTEDQLSEKLTAEQMPLAEELKKLHKSPTLEGETVRQAHVLEGSVRNTGIHACGVIITPSDIREHVPVALSKDANLWCTQFDNSVVENAGLLKMDFLGLKTLTLIKDAIAIVKDKHGIEIDPDEIPLEDVETYELFQRGETVGVFQYESAGMQKYLKELKPSVFGDLIAMNALYRPGPLEYIPSFIRRKHGDEEITYDLDDMKEYLEETYGITVYQEQVMLLSQKLAGFTKGEADMLRKAMGKKIFALLEQMKPKFIDGGKERGHDPKILEKVWKDWEAFAAYAFNKSHSTCYAWIAFQTAYLKAHYPAEYMASVLSNNMNDIKSVTFFMEECRRMGVSVLGPDVNESNYKFTVNDRGEIRFGLGAIKGVGGGAVEAIVNERKENGPFNSIFDLTKRIDLRAANKKTLEGLVLAGGFDSFKTIHRAQYFAIDGSGTVLEKAIKYGNSIQGSADSSQVSMFGEDSGVEIPEPKIPLAPEWTGLEALSREKEVVGIYISGHPLDDFKIEVTQFCNAQVSHTLQLDKFFGKELKFAGIMTVADHRITRKGTPFGSFELEDYSGASKFFLFGEDYLKMKHFLSIGNFIYAKGRIQQRKYREDEKEFKIQSLELLTDIREKLAQGVALSVSAKSVTDQLIEEVEDILSQHKGNHQVKFTIYDHLEKVVVNMPSRSWRVSISNELLEHLEKIEDLEYKIY